MISSTALHHNSPFCRPAPCNLEAAATDSLSCSFSSPPRTRDAFYADNNHAHSYAHSYAYAYPSTHKHMRSSPEPCVSVSVRSSPAHNTPTQVTQLTQAPVRPSKGKQVLPCFNLLCTGTCAYGPKCTFLHDPRAQLPKHVRKPAEFVLQSHLHTFRPNLSLGLRRERERERERDGRHVSVPVSVPVHVCEEDDSSACTDSDCSSTLGAHSHSHSHSYGYGHANGAHKALQSTFRRDDLFDFPTTPLSYQEPNAKCYDPRDDAAQRAGRDRELSMWYHLLAAVSDKNASLATAEEQRTRLPRLAVFQQLSRGHSIAK